MLTIEFFKKRSKVNQPVTLSTIPSSIPLEKIFLNQVQANPKKSAYDKHTPEGRAMGITGTQQFRLEGAIVVNESKKYTILKFKKLYEDWGGKYEANSHILKKTKINKQACNIKMFYSKSKDPNLKYLSNFEPSVVKFKIFKKVMTFPSVEHGFQAMKYAISDQIEYAKEFEVGQKQGLKLPKDIKKEGGRPAFKKRKVLLNVRLWEANKKIVMQRLINSRYTLDAKFRRIIHDIKRDKIKLFHYEGTRGRGVSYWGGSWPASVSLENRDKTNFKGENALGKIILKAKKQHKTPKTS